MPLSTITTAAIVPAAFSMVKATLLAAEEADEGELLEAGAVEDERAAGEDRMVDAAGDVDEAEEEKLGTTQSINKV